MNILIVNKYYFVSGGQERYMFAVVRALESDGHKVVPLALKLDCNRESPYSHYLLKPPFGGNIAKLGEAKLSIFGKLKLAWRTLHYPSARRAVSRIIEQEHIDVVYLLNICNYIGPDVIAGAKDKGVRVVMRLSDFNFVCASYHYMREGKICMECKKNLFNAVLHNCRGSMMQSMIRTAAISLHKYSRIYHKVDAFVCPSKIMKSELQCFGLPQEKIHLLPSFMEMEDQGDSIDIAGRYVLYFGRLSREKGVDVLIKAWQLLGSNAPPLRVVGSGEEEETLKKMSADYKLGTVEFEPFLGREEVMNRIRECAFVVIPSVCHDNAPMAALESMALGKVIVASQVGGLPDQVQDGETGLLVPAGDPQALANAVTILMNDQERLAVMGKMARNRATYAFSQELHMKKLLAIFTAH